MTSFFSEAVVKTCKRCQRELPATLEYFFVRRKKDVNYLQSECKQCASQRLKIWQENNREKTRQNAKNWTRKRRQQALEHYGGTPPKCACCGESHVEFLAMDHINGGGNEHRRSIGNEKSSSTMFYKWLRRNNYPKGFQVLCHNCNCAKSYYGKCPHKEEVSS